MDGRYVTQHELGEAMFRVGRLFSMLVERISTMATQADLDAITAQVTTVATDVQTVHTELQAQIDQLAAANPGLDVSALQAAVAPLDDAVKALGSLTPDPAPTGDAGTSDASGTAAAPTGDPNVTDPVDTTSAVSGVDPGSTPPAS